MEEPHTTILPNSTQVPNIILDEWMGRLNDTEFRILLVVVRQTLGWVADAETGRRKDKDWLSMTQLQMKTGRGRTQISTNIKSLIETYGLIEATDDKGKLLDTAEKRKRNRGNIWYRLTIREPELTLFDRYSVRKPDTSALIVRIPNTRKPNTTKETHTNKRILASEVSDAPDEKVEKPIKTYSDHALFVRFFYESAKATRGVKPKITAPDGKMLKRILEVEGIPRDTLEQAAVFFLTDRDFRQFSPTIKTLLSNGVITGILNRMQNQPDFWKKLDSYASHRGIRTALEGDPAKIAQTTKNLVELREALTKRMSMAR